MLKRIREGLRRFFFPPAGSPGWLLVLPYIVMGVLSVLVLIGGVYGWDYSNSPGFCGTTCHTMPPQNITYLKSPHANVSCEECHIGRAFVGDLIVHKWEGVRELYAYTFGTYEYPIIASRLRPARYTCETCHQPEVFKEDKLKVITHFQDDKANSATNIYLILKTGGGAKRESQGKGIHWHIVNKVEYYETDPLGQTIPYVRAHNDDGTITEYTDVQSGFDPKTVDESKLRVMDCTSCHNRVSHNFKSPSTSMDEDMAKKLIDQAIPEIHKKGVEVLSVAYKTQAEGLQAIAGLENYYQTEYADFYANNAEAVKTAVTQIQNIFKDTVFFDQKINWETHPNNLGHMETAGCFRCHDGKHLDANQQAIRLECNICHSIPMVATAQDFVTKIEISRGPEPESHRNANWISLHNKAFDPTCANCHTTENAGSTVNTSFCSNNACHGSVFTYAGFDAPKLRDILLAQLPTPAPSPATETPGIVGDPTYDNSIGALFTAKCAMCHQGASAPKGLDLSTYAGLMQGGAEGAVITPNDSANSVLVQVQSGEHFATFSADELTLIKQWIDAGAPGPEIQTPAATPTPAAAVTNPTYDANIAAILNAKCAMCHQGASAPEGLDLSSFASLMKGGNETVVIVAGDSANSSLIQVQSGQHFANLTPEELALFKQWIDAGAPEK